MQIALIYEKYSQILKIKDMYGCDEKKEDGYGGLVGHVIELKNKYILVPCVGCMHIYNTIHCLHQKYGIDVFIRIGSCGVLSDEIDLGSILLIKEAMNKDALSAKYFSDIEPVADMELLSFFKKHLDYPISNTFTIDVVWEKACGSVSTVDMETAALYCYSNKNCLHAVSISVARDNKNGRIENQELNDLIKDSTRKMINLLEKYY